MFSGNISCNFPKSGNVFLFAVNAFLIDKPISSRKLTLGLLVKCFVLACPAKDWGFLLLNDGPSLLSPLGSSSDGLSDEEGTEPLTSLNPSL